MFRLWGKEFKDNHMLRDTVICDETDETRTHKIFNALDSICYEFDLSKPIWLDHNIDEFKRHDKTRFYQDNFVDSIDLIIWRFILLKNKLCINNKKEVRRPPFTEGLPDFFLIFYSFLIAASGLSFIARFAGKYPASTPTSTANTMDISTSHHGI